MTSFTDCSETSFTPACGKARKLVCTPPSMYPRVTSWIVSALAHFHCRC